MRRRTLWESFHYAIKGILYALLTQPNMRYHLLAAIAAVTLGLLFDINLTKLLLVIFAIFLVFITEMINTAVEITVDLYTREQKQLAATAKDVAAGAVLLAAANALILGYLVFFDKLNRIVIDGFQTLRVIDNEILFLILLILLIVTITLHLYIKNKLSVINLSVPFFVGMIALLFFYFVPHSLLAFVLGVIIYRSALFLGSFEESKQIFVILWMLIGIIFGILIVALL